MEAAAFELLLLRTLADYTQLPAAFRSLGRNYGGLVDRVGFHSDPLWAAEVVA